MPRLEFSKPKNFCKWLKSRNSEKNEAYITNNEEVIILPKVSTRPIMRAHYTGELHKDVKILLKRFEQYKVDKIEWKSDSPPGVIREK